MNGNTTRGHFPAPRSRWSFTRSRWAGVFSAPGVGGALLCFIRSLVKAYRGPPWTILRAGFSEIVVDSSRSIVVVAFERRR